MRKDRSIAEFDYEMVDPRTYYRYLKRDIEEVVADTGYKYRIHEPDGENPAVNAENVGGRSGRIVGRLIARTNWEKFAGERTETETSPIGAIITAVIGILLALWSFTMRGTQQGVVLGLGIVFLILAAVLYYFNSPNVTRSEYYYRKRTRILMQGEAAEHTADEDDPADIVASDMTVIVSEGIEIEHRDSTGSQRMSRDQLSPDVQNRLDTGYTPITNEVDFQSDGTDVYCYRVS